MKRIVVNVATAPGGDVGYRARQGRLAAKLNEFGDCQHRMWTDVPKGSPKHSDVPYAFKAYALKEASFGVDLIMWMDSSICPLRSLEPVWHRILVDGYFIPSNPGMFNYEWTADSAYADLFPDWEIEKAREVSKGIPHCSSSVFGMDLNTETGRQVFFHFWRLAHTNAFRGPWANSNGPDKDRYSMPHLQRYTTAPCGPSDVRGHRHDQTALSVIAWRLDLPLSPDLYAHPAGCPEPDESVILYHMG